METLSIESIKEAMIDRNLRAVANKSGVKYTYLRKILSGAEVTTLRHQAAIERLSKYLLSQKIGGKNENIA